MIRILNAEPENYSPEARRILTSIGELVERRLSQAELSKWVSDFDVLIVRLGLVVDKEVIEAGHRLRAIVTATTGLDHIDVESAKARGIAVLSLQGETDFLRGIPATAEHTWGLLLALVRRIPQAFESVRAGEWNRDAFRGHDLEGKRLGIVGLGRIGEKVAHYGIAFGMKVFAYDPYRKCWPDTVSRCISLHDLLRCSEVLSLHVPLNQETQGMIGKIELSLLPRGAVLVNTSRGAVLDEEALVEALEKGHLGGAAVDVIEAEFDVTRRQRSPLLEYARQHSNLIITPHIGGATVESMAKTEVFMAKKLSTFLQAVLKLEE
jgi:D-3-phosphoglycerate dehydrogenase